MDHFKHIKVTTTSSLQNVEIEEYIEPISVSIVIGMNFFKDFITHFRDFFGGKSTMYSKSLEKINQQAIYELRKKAHYLKADYVIGLTIENDEISAQGKSMLMVTAMGTAVKIVGESKKIINNSTSFSLEIFQQLELKNKLVKNAEKNELTLNEKNWNLILENQIFELSQFLLLKFIDNSNSTDFREKIITFFETIEEESAIKEIFKFIKANPEKDLNPTLRIIKDLNLVDLKQNLTLFNSNEEGLYKIGAIIAGIHKKIYFKSDIKIIKETIKILDEKFPMKSEYYESYDNLMNKDILIWKCECGKENSAERNLCKKCNKDIHGMKNTSLNLKEIKDNLRHRLEILENNFA